MPFSTEVQAEYQYLINEVMRKATFNTPEDFDLFGETITPIFDNESLSPLNRKFKDEFDDLNDILNGFDIYATDKIIYLKKANQGADKESDREDVPAFTSDKITPEEKLADAKISYRLLISTAITISLNKLINKSKADRETYILEQQQRRNEAKIANEKFTRLESKNESIEISSEDLVRLLQVRAYIYSEDERGLQNHPARAASIAAPGLYELAPAIREFEYERFILNLNPTMLGESDLTSADEKTTINDYKVESIFRAVEVFPSHREDIYEQIKDRIERLNPPISDLKILRLAFPAHRIETELSKSFEAEFPELLDSYPVATSENDFSLVRGFSSNTMYITTDPVCDDEEDACINFQSPQNIRQTTSEVVDDLKEEKEEKEEKENNMYPIELTSRKSGPFFSQTVPNIPTDSNQDKPEAPPSLHRARSV